MNHIIRTLSLLALLSTACGEPPDDDSLDGLTPDCTPGVNGIACADDPTHPVTYKGAGFEDGKPCTIISTPAHGYYDCK